MAPFFLLVLLLVLVLAGLAAKHDLVGDETKQTTREAQRDEPSAGADNERIKAALRQRLDQLEDGQ